MINNKLKHQITNINSIDKAQETQNRIKWLQYNHARAEFIKDLRSKYPKKEDYNMLSKKGKKEIAKAYSDAVVAWDKQFDGMCVFDIEMGEV